MNFLSTVDSSNFAGAMICDLVNVTVSWGCSFVNYIIHTIWLYNPDLIIGGGC